MRRTLLLLLAALLLPTAAAAQSDVTMEGIPEIPRELVDRLSQYQAARRASLSDIDATGERILVSTRLGEVPQVHLVDHPGGARTQLTFRAERSHSPRFAPADDGAILFMGDIGGDEQHQVFRLDRTTGRYALLTSPGSRNTGPLWDDPGERLVWASTERNGKDFDLWISDGKSRESARMLVEGAGYFNATSWSADGTLLMAHEYVSAADARLHLVDVAEGSKQRIAGGTRKDTAAWDTAVFGRSNDELFVASDKDGEFIQLYRGARKGRSWRWEPLTADIPWDVSSVTISRDRATLAFTVNEGGWSTLYTMDTASGERVKVGGLPRGLVYGLRFAAEAPVLGFSLTGPDRTTDAWTTHLETGENTQWTFSEMGGLDPRRFIEPELITYESFDGLEVPAFYYRPQGTGPFPVMISIHGGPEGQARPWFSAPTQYWCKELGIAILVPNVRGSTGYGRSYHLLDNGMKREDSVEDIGALLDWVATRPELDPERVGVVGGSYGGYMVLASLVHFGDRLKVGIDRVGISNFVTFLENTKEYRRDVRRAEYGDERDPEMREFLQSISPLNHVDRIRSALMVSQGANDPRVPASEAEQIVEAVRGQGGEVWYLLAHNEGHGFRRQSNRDLWLQAATLFLEQHLLPVSSEE